jgi:AcrR family transcriptional regulator
MTSDTARPRGRPRDATIDVRVLDATRALLTEQGFEATTVQAIAERSGVHASAIYRRWSSRTEIIELAAFGDLSSIAVAPTGDLHHDLRRFIRAYLAAIREPAPRAALFPLFAAYQADDRDRSPEVWFAISVRPQFIAILRAAPPGAVDPGVDADDVFDALLGALLARVAVPTIVQRDRPVERLVELVLRMLQPRRVTPR